MVVLAVTLLSILIAGNALAAGYYYGYNLTVPKLSIGSVVTYNVTKVSSTQGAVVCSTQVGGNYTLRAGIELVDNTVAANYKPIGDNQRQDYDIYPKTAGAQYHARLKSYINTLVDVQAIGKWSPDNPGSCGY